ncbi:MAG: YicC family protein [Gammaproteobacteria bacterium]|nr:MAG: YicC family protein [Gammaproteobacteria bacterium]
MTQSMTAFARVERQTPWGTLSCEVRSVNHRFLETSCRLPDELRPSEMILRDAIGQALSRGKVDFSMRFRDRELETSEYAINTSMLQGLMAATKQLTGLSVDLQPLRAVDLLRWPGLLQSPEIDGDALRDEALTLLNETLQSLVDMRRREGQRLAKLIGQRLQAIEGQVQEVRKIMPEVASLREQRLRERLEVLKTELEPGRLEQELVIMAQKSDVEEELDRLQAHVVETMGVLKRDEPIGRRLDFLMQEFNREANTLGSKSIDTRITNAAVELKVLIEQMREQVQNIE